LKPLLLYKTPGLELQQLPLPWNEKDLTRDLELDVLFTAMAGDDEFILEVVNKVILTSLNNDVDTILYRQNILQDCFKNTAVINEIYKIVIDAVESRKISWYGIFTKYPSSILSGSVSMMHLFLDLLKRLRSVADEHSGSFQSEGFTCFFSMLQKELTDEYLNTVEQHLENLGFDDGMLLSAFLDKGNKSNHYTLRKFYAEKKRWWQWIFPKKSTDYTFSIHPRDISGANALSEIKDQGINLAANTLAQSCDNILQFFKLLRTELAFYMGCTNLHSRLIALNEPVCFPTPLNASERNHSCNELYDVCLALKMKHKLVGNALNAIEKNLIMITGANQGGKTTFLRGIGIAQLMMQSGMFVPAEQFNANVCDAMFTHFKREEDETMKSGKFDEELSRMNEIVKHLTPNSMLLFNESFAATNEREGPEIAGQIVRALMGKNLKIFFVTHLYEFASAYYKMNLPNAVFLRAERKEDEERTFKLIEQAPLQTSFGVDIYRKIFQNPILKISN
jgi:DNA mismatch repair ATPase MutS